MKQATDSKTVWGHVKDEPWETPGWLWYRFIPQRKCYLEVIPMVKECGNCPIKSRFGAIEENMRSQSHKQPAETNERPDYRETKKKWETGTWQYTVLADYVLIWNGGDVNEEKCTRHFVEKGVGNLTVTANPEISRLTDASNELDFMLSSEVPTGELCFDKNISTRTVLGKSGIHIKVNPTSASKRDAQSEINLTGHMQFLQNSVVDKENRLMQKIRHNYCENQRNKLNQAIVAAQYNGWIGASILGLPYCTRLIPTALSAFVQECESKIVKFVTQRDKCGAKPTWNNHTISINGKELAKDVDCYWKGSIVTMGTQTYTLVNDNWTVIGPNYEIKMDKAEEKIAYQVANAMENIFSRDLEKDDFIVSHMYALADLVAVVNDHENDPQIGRPQISAALIKSKEVENHSLLHSMAKWFRYFGWITFIVGAVFLLFRLFGGQSIVWGLVGCCGMPSWITSLLSCNIGGLIGNKKKPEQIELRTPTATTIINMPLLEPQTVQEKEPDDQNYKPSRSERRVRRWSRRRRSAE